MIRTKVSSVLIVIALFSLIQNVQSSPLVHDWSWWGKATVEEVKQYINAGGNVNATSPKNNDLTVLHMAAKNKNPKVIELLIDAGADIYAAGYDVDKSSPLSFAAEENINAAVITVFINAGSVVNNRGDDGWTPLHWAALKNPNSSVTIALIEGGADIDAQDENGETPLHLLLRDGRGSAPPRGILSALREAGANFYIKDEDGVTALELLRARGL